MLIAIQTPPQKPAVDLVGKLPTRTRGPGMQRVDEGLPVPLPQRTLPTTRTGFKTPDNH